MDHTENELLTKVGPGTAAGETLRKYWLPVGLSSEVNSEAPKLVRWLGEDLLLFRDEFGRVGLTEPTCPHRGASLDYGWIEAGGILLLSRLGVRRERTLPGATRRAAGQ